MQPPKKRMPDDLALFLTGITTGLIPVVCGIATAIIAQPMDYNRSCQVGLGGCVIGPSIALAVLVFLVAIVPATWFSIKKLGNRGIGKWKSLAVTVGGYAAAFITYSEIVNYDNPDNYPYVLATFAAYVVLGLFYVVAGFGLRRLGNRANKL